MRCSELESLLRSLGFGVTKGKSGKHRMIEHVGIPELIASNFDGGHGKDAQIKPVYIRDMRKLLEKYHAQLSYLLEKR